VERRTRSPKWCHGVSVDLVTDLKNMADCQEWDKQEFDFERQIFGKLFGIQKL
jgi:hypothetical protein